MTPEYLKLKAKINRKINLLAKHTKELQDLKNSCPHEEIEPRQSFHAGSYYDTARSMYWNQCKLCGAKSEITSKGHGWYG